MEKEKEVVEPEKGKEQEAIREKVIEKKYDDNDLNNLIVRDRAEYLKKEFGIEDPKKVKDFVKQMKEQEESSKTELQKKDEELLGVKGQLNTKEQEVFDLKARDKARDLGVHKDYLNDVIVLAKAKVTETTDFDTALSKVLEQYPNFKTEKKIDIKFGVEAKEVQDKDTKPRKNYF